jgi:hypothetical protein
MVGLFVRPCAKRLFASCFNIAAIIGVIFCEQSAYMRSGRSCFTTMQVRIVCSVNQLSRLVGWTDGSVASRVVETYDCVRSLPAGRSVAALSLRRCFMTVPFIRCSACRLRLGAYLGAVALSARVPVTGRAARARRIWFSPSLSGFIISTIVYYTYTINSVLPLKSASPRRGIESRVLSSQLQQQLRGVCMHAVLRDGRFSPWIVWCLLCVCVRVIPHPAVINGN